MRRAASLAGALAACLAGCTTIDKVAVAVGTITEDAAIDMCESYAIPYADFEAFAALSANASLVTEYGPSVIAADKALVANCPPFLANPDAASGLSLVAGAVATFISIEQAGLVPVTQ